MTAAAPLLSPGSRVVAGWWRSLSAWRPQALWLGSFALHHVEALVRVAEVHALDRFRLLLLEALRTAPAGSADRLESHLHLGTQFVNQALLGLATEGLTHAQASHTWALTPLGLQALRDDGRYVRTSVERRGFHFLDSAGGAQEPAPPPHYLSLANFSCSAWTTAGDFRFDPALLQACIEHGEEWKQRHGFPVEVRELLLPATVGGPDGQEPDPLLRLWQRIVLDRPERLVAVLISAPTEQGGESLFAFEVAKEGWELDTSPVFTLAADWRRVIPELAEEPPLDSWRQAWRGWCQQRNLPGSDADQSALERHGHQLRVTVPPRLFDRLQSSRSDALQGEAWLLTGNGRLRTAAQVEVRNADARPVPGQS